MLSAFTSINQSVNIKNEEGGKKKKKVPSSASGLPTQIINDGGLKPLSFGVVCYPAITNTIHLSFIS